ncbi:MAG: DUF805 domain-containing protein [Bacteroidales bacterium]|nr:DUF805 domain-containing protein [Bacteroidales bacterium]
MTFFDSLKSCFIRYADFKSPAARSEYVWFMAFCLSILIGLFSLNVYFYCDDESYIEFGRHSWSMGQNYFKYLLCFSVALLPPIFAVTIRRLKTIGKSPFLCFLHIPMIFVFTWLPYLLHLSQNPYHPVVHYDAMQLMALITAVVFLIFETTLFSLMLSKSTSDDKIKSNKHWLKTYLFFLPYLIILTAILTPPLFIVDHTYYGLGQEEVSNFNKSCKWGRLPWSNSVTACFTGTNYPFDYYLKNKY